LKSLIDIIIFFNRATLDISSLYD